MSKLIILITGLPGSGKSSAAEVIKKKFNADIVNTGDIIREEVKKRGLEYTPKTDAFVAHWFHTGGREKLLVKRAWNKIKKSKKKIIVIDGLRSDEQLKYLEKLAKTKLFIIAIITSFKVRAERELKRGRFGKEETMGYLKTREKLEKSHGIDKLIKKADYKINNTKLTKKQMEGRIVGLIKKLIKTS